MKNHMKKLAICLVVFCVLMGSITSLSAADWSMFQGNQKHTGYVPQDASFATQTWTVPVNGSVNTTPVLYGDKVYLGTEEGTLYALDAQDGNESWTYTTDGAIESSPAVDGGTVYVGSDDGYLYSNNADNGDNNWKFKAGDRDRKSVV